MLCDSTVLLNMKRLILSIILSLVYSLSAEEVSLTVEGKILSGELELAEKKASRIAFLISGSGPTDRDGNTTGAPGKNNSLKYLSEYLSKAGIPSLRVDKRGVGASAVIKEIDLRFFTYVSDVESWIKFLEGKGFSEIILIGHSEGALVASLAAKHKSVVGLISVAGAGRPAPEVLRSQLKPKLPKSLYDKADKAISTLTKGEAVKDFPPALISLFRPSIQHYLISWFKFDPVEAISDLSIPVLIVQGNTDLQISLDDAKLLQAGAKAGQIKIIEGMNHVLKKVKGDMKDQLPSYFDPKLPLHKDFGKAVLKFVLESTAEQNAADQPATRLQSKSK